jgi:hypothetical protein
LTRFATSIAPSDKDNVPIPADGETVEIHVGHASYAVRIIDKPFYAADHPSSDENNVESIEPVETQVGSCLVSLLDAAATGQKVAADGSIVLAPRGVVTDDTPKLYLSDGEVLLTDLRADLIAKGMRAEYRAQSGYSQLVVNNKVVVKRQQEGGRMSIEGPLCEDFYIVRSVIFNQYVNL